MQIRLISVGRVRQEFVLAGEAEYLKRLRGSAKVELVEVPAAEGREEARAKAEEAQAVLRKVREHDYLVVLDEAGRTYTSPGLAAHLRELMNRGSSSFTFAIGGFHGWSDEIRARADLILSLSPMTFTFQMSRLILVEQIYRAVTILKGLPYHK